MARQQVRDVAPQGVCGASSFLFVAIERFFSEGYAPPASSFSHATSMKAAFSPRSHAPTSVRFKQTQPLRYRGAGPSEGQAVQCGRESPRPTVTTEGKTLLCPTHFFESEITIPLRAVTLPLLTVTTQISTSATSRIATASSGSLPTTERPGRPNFWAVTQAGTHVTRLQVAKSLAWS